MTTKKPTVDQIFGGNKAPLTEVLSADFSDLLIEVNDAARQALELALIKPKTDEDQAVLGKRIIDLRALCKKVDETRSTEKAPILEAGRGLDEWFKGMTGQIEAAAKKLQANADDYARAKAAEERARAQREAEEARRKADEERRKAEAAKTPETAGRADARAEALDSKADRAEATAAASDADLIRSRVGGVTASAKGAWVPVIVDYQAAIAPLGALGIFLKEDAIKAALGAMAKTQKAGAKWPGVQFSQDVKATFR